MDERSLFLAALDKTDPAERAAFLDAACPDPELRRQVEKLLAAHAGAGDFLEQPAEPGNGTGAFVSDRDSSRLAPTPAEGVGTVLGPYKLLQRLGEGGMGAVFLAEQEQPVRRKVAVKVIKPGMDSAQVIARFEQKRQALALMDHPNIAKVLDAGTTPTGRPYFVMELVKGIPITKFCDQEHLTPKERLELFIPVCQAVQHAHHKGVIHRDLKPSNVLIALYDGRPVPKVIDFGVAKATSQKLTERTMFTEVGSIVGTLEYMAPEQAELNNLDIDTRADVYSLGVLLYELLTGSPPFTGKQLRTAGFSEMMRLIREVEPPKPSTKLSSSAELPSIAARRKLEPRRLTKLVSGDLDWIAMKCLEKDRGRRYETANGLAMDIQRYLADEPVLAGPPGAGYRLRKFARKHKRAVGTAAAFAGLLAAGMVVSTWLAVRARVAEHRATEERDRAVEAERRTIAEKERADAINDFLLKDLLAQASTEEQAALDVKPDPNVTVRTLLDRAAERVGPKFAKQPQVEAAIRLTLGMTYKGLSLYPEAEKHLQRAVELRRQALSDDNPETWSAVYELWGVYFARGQVDTSEGLAVQILEARRRLLGEGHPDTLRALAALAAAYGRQGKLDKAEPLLTRLAEVAPGVWGEDHRITFSSRGNLAATWLGRGQFARAEPLLAQCLETACRVFGEEHPDTLDAMRNLARAYAEQNRYAEAERLLKNALETARRVLSEKHRVTLSCRNTLGLLYTQMGQWAKAEEAHTKNLEIARSFLGDQHPLTMSAMFNLALTWARQGQYDRAEPLLVQALELRRRLSGNEDTDTLFGMATLGEVYLNLGRLDRAEELLRECLDLCEKVHSNTYYSASAQSLLGRVRAQQKKYAEAEPLLQTGYEVLKANVATTPWRFRHYRPVTAEWLVQLYDEWGKPDEAAKWRQELEEMKAKDKPRPGP